MQVGTARHQVFDIGDEDLSTAIRKVLGNGHMENDVAHYLKMLSRAK
jgi:hypothetical protein